MYSLYGIQGQRRTAARDSCYLDRELVFAATPPDQIAAANTYINHTALVNCNGYANHVAPGILP